MTATFLLNDNYSSGESFKSYIDDDYDDIDDNISLSQHSYHNSHHEVKENSDHEMHPMMPCDLDNPYFDHQMHHRVEHHRVEHHRVEHHQVEHHQVEHHQVEHQTILSVQSIGLTCIYENDEYNDEGSTDIESIESGRTKRFKSFQNLIDNINVSVSTLESSKGSNDEGGDCSDNYGKNNMQQEMILLPIQDSESDAHHCQNHDGEEERQEGTKQIWKQLRRSAMTHDCYNQAELLHIEDDQSLKMYNDNKFHSIDNNDTYEEQDENDERSNILQSFRSSVELTSPSTSATSLDKSSSINCSQSGDSNTNFSSSFSTFNSGTISNSSSNNDGSIRTNRSIRFSTDDDATARSNLTNDPDLNIDDDIVTNILKDSRQRSIRLQRQQSVRRMCNTNCWKRSLIGTIAFFSVVALTLITFIFLGHKEEEKEKDFPKVDGDGQFNFYDDRSDYRDPVDYESDLHIMILKDPIPIDERMIPIHMMHHLIDRDQLIDANDNIKITETSFFWKIPHTGHVIESVMSNCFNLALASDLIDEVMPDMLHHSNELLIFNVDNVRYVNVDLSDREGIKGAGELGLAKSGLADVISTKYVSFAADYLFDVQHQKGRLFTLLRHPVEQAIMSYHHFLSNSKSSELTLQQYIASPYMKENWLTHFLSTLNNLEDSVNIESLNFAKEILRRKCLVGVHDNLEESIELFANYFHWAKDDTPSEVIADQNQCIADEIDHSRNSTNSFYKRIIKQRYDIEYGSDIYDIIVAKNELDMDLYWYAYDLHKAQFAQMNSLLISERSN